MSPSKFQFVQPYLIELHFDINSDFNSSDAEFEMQNSFNVEINRDEESNSAKVILTLETNSDLSKSPFILRVKVGSDFIWEDLEEKAVESYLNCNAPALLLGYMRPIVSGITNSSIYPPYNIPFVNFRN